MGKLVISRPNWTDSLSKYRILIDGHRSEYISIGQTLKVELPAGDHEIVARIHWCRSKPLRVKIDSLEACHVQVDSLLPARCYSLIIFAMSFVYLYFGSYVALAVLGALCFAPVTLLSHRYLAVRPLTAPDVAARRCKAMRHPDALPPIRLPHDMFTAG